MIGEVEGEVEREAEAFAWKADNAMHYLEDAVVTNRFKLGQHERDTFNDKFMFVLLLVVGTPCISSLLVSSSPALTYWIGKGGFIVGVGCFLWIFLGYQFLNREAIHRRLAVINLLVIPVIALTVVSHFNKLTALDIHTQLSVQDCIAFPAKTRLEHAWQDASDLLDSCLIEHARLTGSTLEELQRVDGVHRCPGYEKGREKWKKEWDYLQLLEQEEQCSGWCESRRSLWHAAPPEQLRRPDRCSIVVARAMKSQIYRTSKQITFYCLAAVVVLGAGLSLIEV